MAGRESANGKKQSRNAAARRCGVAMGGALSAFVAAAAMATGSAAPARADFEDLLDPIIQPLLTSVTDSLSGVDPALATDLTSWTDSLLASLNAIDPAAAAAATAQPAEAAPAADSPTSGTYDIPITVQEDTEPTVQATVDGSDTTLLLDTGSSGLVIPYTDLGSNFFSQLESLLDLGFPTGISESGYSGGVQYIYLEYNDVPIDYGNGTLDTTGPVDVEIFSWSDSDAAGAPANLADFLQDDDVTGILGIGASDAGPTTSPLESAGYDGVTVNIPNAVTDPDGQLDGDLIVSPTNPGTAIDTLDGAPTPSSELTETVKDGSATVGTGSVYDDIDSGGVYGTIPSSIDASTVAQGDTITVSDGSTVLYSYTVGTDTAGTDQAPDVGSGIGTSQDDSIDSGIEAFLGHPIYIDYAADGGDGTLSFDDPLS